MLLFPSHSLISSHNEKNILQNFAFIITLSTNFFHFFALQISRIKYSINVFSLAIRGIAISVAKCSNDLATLAKLFPKGGQRKFLHKTRFFENSPNIHWATFVRHFLTSIFKNRPIWSHWLHYTYKTHFVPIGLWDK